MIKNAQNLQKFKKYIFFDCKTDTGFYFKQKLGKNSEKCEFKFQTN